MSKEIDLVCKPLNEIEKMPDSLGLLVGYTGQVLGFFGVGFSDKYQVKL